MENKEIESKLFELVKACINDENFIMNRVKTDRFDYRYHCDVYTGVVLSIDEMSKIVPKYGKCIREKEYNFQLFFENTPDIIIKSEFIDEKISYEDVLVKRSDVYNYNPFDVFKSRMVTVKNEIKTYTHGYFLTCGEFKVSLTNQQVLELFELYQNNLIEFKKKKESVEIISRFEQFLK